MKPFAIPCSKRIPIQQSLPHKIGNVVGGVITRLVGAILLEQNDEWQLQHRYMTLETMAGRTDEQPATLTHIAA